MVILIQKLCIYINLQLHIYVNITLIFIIQLKRIYFGINHEFCALFNMFGST